MKIRTQLKAGGWSNNHNEALRVRTAVKAGKLAVTTTRPCRFGPASRVASCGTFVTTSLKKIGSRCWWFAPGCERARAAGSRSTHSPLSPSTAAGTARPAAVSPNALPNEPGRYAADYPSG